MYLIEVPVEGGGCLVVQVSDAELAYGTQTVIMACGRRDGPSDE